MVQRLFTADTLGGIEAKHSRQQINSQRVSVREQRREEDARLDREGPNIILRARGTDATQRVFRRRTEIMQNLVQLVHIVAPLEYRLPTKELCKDTSNGPDVDRSGLKDNQCLKHVILGITYVVGKAQHDFRSAIPARRNILGHETLVPSRLGGSTPGREATSETKVTDLELAISIDEQISRLEIAVKDVR